MVLWSARFWMRYPTSMRAEGLRLVKVVVGACVAAAGFVLLSAILIPFGYALLSWPFLITDPRTGARVEPGWTALFLFPGLLCASTVIGFFAGGILRLGSQEALFTGLLCSVALAFAWQVFRTGALEPLAVLETALVAAVSATPPFVFGARAGARSRAAAR